MPSVICRLCKLKRPVKRSKVVVVHHNDFDGIMGAVALFRLHSSDDFVSISTSRRKVLKSLKKAISERPDLLYVVDIGPNDHELDELERLLKDRKFKLVWMDHHKWSQKTLEKMRLIVDELIYDRSTCGAGLAARYAKERGAKLCDCCEELVELSCDIDLWIRKDQRSEKMSLALGNKRWRRFLIDKLWKCVGWDADWEEAYEEAVRSMEESLQKYLKRAVEGEVDGISYLLVPIKLKDVAHVSFMAEEIRKRKTYDVIAFISDAGSLHMRRGTEKVDLSELAKEFSGGGHPAAAGGSLNYSLIDKIMHKLFLVVNEKKFELGLRAYSEKAHVNKSVREAELS